MCARGIAWQNLKSLVGRKNMKKYYIRSDVKTRYILAGIGAIILLILLVAVHPVVYKKSILNILFYILAFSYTSLHILRYKICYLKLDNVNVEFYDGVVDWKKIPVNEITKIEYNPEIVLRFYLQNADTAIRIPNIFCAEDMEDFFLTLRQYKASIDVQYVFKSKQNGRQEG